MLQTLSALLLMLSPAFAHAENLDTLLNAQTQLVISPVEFQGRRVGGSGVTEAARVCSGLGYPRLVSYDMERIKGEDLGTEVAWVSSHIPDVVYFIIEAAAAKRVYQVYSSITCAR